MQSYVSSFVHHFYPVVASSLFYLFIVIQALIETFLKVEVCTKPIHYCNFDANWRMHLTNSNFSFFVFLFTVFVVVTVLVGIRMVFVYKKINKNSSSRFY